MMVCMMPLISEPPPPVAELPKPETAAALVGELVGAVVAVGLD
jgi:hypothetical protein